MKEKILNKLNDYYPNETEYNKDLANELFLLYSVGCSSCEEIPKGSFYLGMSCEECNTPFRIVKNKQ